MALNLPTASRRIKRLAAILAILGAYAGVTTLLAQRYAAVPEDREHRIEIRGDWFFRNGEKFLVKGVGYDPTRPGELPWARHHSSALLESDFARIRAAGFNTIRTWEALSRDELDEAQRQGLAVIQGIWIDPDGHFSDPQFQRESSEKVTRMVRGARRSPAILAYLIMNEPKPGRVLTEGVEPTRAFIRSLAAAVRDLDPGVPIGFASWPGLEFLDEPSLDFAAVNLYPFRPAVLREAIGYEGMVRLWKERLAPTRPLLITEYGISVSPMAPKVNDPGGATEAQQAAELPKLADGLMKGGAAGGSVFMWIDGWWKNNDVPHDEMTHDSSDGEEWFGLVAMDNLSDVLGRPRPALAAMEAWNRTVLTLPTDGDVAAREVEFEAAVTDPGEITVELALNEEPPVLLPTARDGMWVRGRLGLLAHARGPQRAEFTLIGPRGVIARFERTLIPPGEAPVLALTASGGGEPRTVTVKAVTTDGRPLTNAPVRLAVTEASHRYDQFFQRTTDKEGMIALPVYLPEAPNELQVVAGLPAAAADADAANSLAVISILIEAKKTP